MPFSLFQALKNTWRRTTTISRQKLGTGQSIRRICSGRYRIPYLFRGELLYFMYLRAPITPSTYPHCSPPTLSRLNCRSLGVTIRTFLSNIANVTNNTLGTPDSPIDPSFPREPCRRSLLSLKSHTLERGLQVDLFFNRLLFHILGLRSIMTLTLTMKTKDHKGESDKDKNSSPNHPLLNPIRTPSPPLHPQHPRHPRLYPWPVDKCTYV